MSIKYFVRANTCTGEVSYLKSNLYDIDKIYLIQSEFGYLKSTFISRLCAYIEEHSNNYELIYNPDTHNKLDGFIVRDKRIAVLDSELMYVNNNCVLIDIDSCIKKKKYNQLVSDAYKIQSEIKEKKKSIYSVYDGAKQVHDEWERVYIDNINFDMLDKYSSDIIDNLVPIGEKKNNITECERFFGSAFYDCNINYIDEITDDIEKRYFIKGRPGTGKSTFLKKLAKALEYNGYSTEVYHCGFDSKSLDMVVCRELSFCVFDSTSPHEKFPSRENDEILDFYTNSGLDGLDEVYEAKFTDIKLRYGKLMSLSKMYMEEMHEITEKFDVKIKENIDYEILNNIVYEFLYEII